MYDDSKSYKRIMNINKDIVSEIAKQYGDAFYILDTEQFTKNFKELLEEFRNYYPETYIAYSYKTNYTPRLCKIVDDLGGYAEVVSHMEMEIARRLGIDYKKIAFNGPYKDKNAVCDMLLNDGHVNLDSMYDFEIAKELADQHPEKRIGVGVRCNFDVGDGVLSRFGFDVDGEDFKIVMNEIKQHSNMYLRGLHCHFANRSLEYWGERARGMVEIVKQYLNDDFEYFCLGGGLFGKMADSLKVQFATPIPTYKEYADTVAKTVADGLAEYPVEKRPKLFIEPGSALVGDAMKFVSKVESIKNVRGKDIATLLGSIYNINPTLNTKNPPIQVIHMADDQQEYENLDFAGFTCIESDYLYKGYNGQLHIGDYVVFGNVGSYSVVLKPPFILPNFPVLELEDNNIKLIKRGEIFDDIFHTFIFERD